MARETRVPRRDRPAIHYKDKDQVLGTIVGTMAGTVSMCWTPKPSDQVFDSTRAKDVLEAALQEINERFVLVLRTDDPRNIA